MSLDHAIPLESRPTRGAARAPQPGGDTLDLAPLEALIGFQIHILDLLVYQLYYERLGKAAMTPGMFSTLIAIKANPGVRQGALADALLIQRPNMTLLVNRLIRAGYVKRRAARGDNRGVELFLRAEGDRALGDIATKLAAHEQSLTAALSRSERARLAALLTKVVRQLRATPRSNGNGSVEKAARGRAKRA